MAGPVISILSTFIIYYVFLCFGLYLLNKFIKTKNIELFIFSQCLIILGIFVILYLFYILGSLKVKIFFNIMDVFTLASFSLAITALFMPKLKLRKLNEKIQIILFLTLFATIIFFLIGLLMIIPNLFGQEIKDNLYILLGTFFYLGCNNLVFAAIVLFIYIYENFMKDIKFPKKKRR